MKIGFIGSGAMAESIAKGICLSGKIANQDIMMSDINSQRLEYIKKEMQVKTTSSNQEVLDFASIVILAVKPQVIEQVLDPIKDLFLEGQTVISIAAGIPLSFLEAKLGEKISVIRVMPNTPSLVGEGVHGLAVGSHVSLDQQRQVETLLGMTGKVYTVKEDMLERLTGLSGSGPAYVYMVIEALADGGIKTGLPVDMAFSIAAQTVLGAAQMVLSTGKHPAELKNKVTSPAGTTIEAVHLLEKEGLRAALIGAVEASTQKARKMTE